MARLFDLDEDRLRIGEMFVAKYSSTPGAQKGLGAHKDGTPWSFVINLNCPDIDFFGGGTMFMDDSIVYRPKEVGTAVLFNGKNLHMGVPITGGTRYILTGFCNYKCESYECHDAFMSSYNSELDGSAGANDVRTGDILRGILIHPKEAVDAIIPSTIYSLKQEMASKNKCEDSLSDEKKKRNFVCVDNLSIDEVQKLVLSYGTQDISLVVERCEDDCNEIDDSCCASADAKHNVAKILAIGGFWSLDEYLKFGLKNK